MRIWKISLGGRGIKKWGLFGGNRERGLNINIYDSALVNVELNTPQGSQDFTIDTNNEYQKYLFIIIEKTAGSVATTVGLHHFQIYTYLK